MIHWDEPYAVHSVRVSLRVRLARTRDKVRRWFPGGPIVTLSPPISPFPIDFFKGLPMCYPRLPVGSGLLTRVGVGSSKSSSLVWQVQPCPCLSVTVLCNSRWGQRNVRGGGSRQIMIGQLYILVVSVLYLLVNLWWYIMFLFLSFLVSLLFLPVSLNKVPHWFCSA